MLPTGVNSVQVSGMPPLCLWLILHKSGLGQAVACHGLPCDDSGSRQRCVRRGVAWHVRLLAGASGREKDRGWSDALRSSRPFVAV